MLCLAAVSFGELLFENPWPVVVVLIGVAAVLRTVGRRRGQRGAVIASWVALAVGLGVWGMARLVETDRETLQRQTGELIAATSPVDEAALRRLLADDAVLLGPDGDLWDRLEPGFISAELSEHQVVESELRQATVVVQSDVSAMASIDVRSEFAGRPIPTRWQLEWVRRRGEPWRVRSMQWMLLFNQPPTRSLYR